ncbi:MAG: hypothetical protein SGJ27_21725 [Candidatus Melainabacteria bacterium]|nr:hypothetical protein [Candidatus Melainabacteria bacterium]
MVETFPSSRELDPAEDARTVKPSDASKVDEQQSSSDELNRSLLSEFWQSMPSAKSGEPKLVAQRSELAQVANASSDTPEPPPPGGNPVVVPRVGQDRAPLPPRNDSLADVISGQKEPKIESLLINGKQVKVKSVETGADRSRIIVLNEDYGVNPAGTKITFFDTPIFPQGKRSQHGNLLALAELPNGSKVFTKVGGNVVYDLATPIDVDKNGGAKSKFFEELPNGTQLWRTTDGTMIEKHATDSLSTPKGKIERIELNKSGKLQYTTQDSKTFTIEQQGGKLLVTDLVGDKAVGQTKLDSLKEGFDPPYNHPFYGPVLSRTREPGAIKLDLGNRGECSIYLEPQDYDGKRKMLSVISDPKDSSSQIYLNDGSVVHTRLGNKDRDWIKTEAKTDGTQTVFYKNGDSTTRYPSGDRTERYKDGLATSLEGKVVEVQRSKDKNTYVLADGGKVEMKLKGLDPLIKTTKDGTPQIMREDSIKEHFDIPQPTAYGNIKTLETKNTGETTYWLADQKEYAKITLLGAPRNDFKGYVTYPDGTNRMVHASGKVLPTMTLSENQAKGIITGELKPSMIPNLSRLDYHLLFSKQPPAPSELIPDVLDMFKR